MIREVIKETKDWLTQEDGNKHLDKQALFCWEGGWWFSRKLGGGSDGNSGGGDDNDGHLGDHFAGDLTIAGGGDCSIAQRFNWLIREGIDQCTESVLVSCK